MALINNYKVITVTHHSLNVRDLGVFYIHPSRDEVLADAINRIKAEFKIDECIYLETCNRVCFILYNEETFNSAFLASFFKSVNPELSVETLKTIQKFVSAYEGDQAIRHVFELASSMDSLIVGEREIFRQFRKAYDFSLNHGLCGDNLRLLENATVATAKKIYHNTKIGEKALSVVSLAMQAIQNKKLSPDSRILLIGSGETNTLVGKFLLKYKFNSVCIYNRSIDNARALSEMMGAPSFHLRDLENIDGQFDIIFICTSANQVIIDIELYKKMLGGCGNKKTIVDLSVPRNVSEDVVSHFDVDYIDIEALRILSEKNLAFRKLELEKAKPLINKSIAGFQNMFHSRQIEKVLARVPEEINAVKARALDSVYKKRIETLDPQSQSLLVEMMDYMEKKCVSIPMKMTREALLNS